VATTRAGQHDPPFLDEERERLRRLIRFDVLTAATAELVIIGTYLFVVRSSWLPVLSVVVGLSGATMALAYRPLGRGDPEGAVRWLAFANWTVALIAAAIATFAWPLMMLAALLPAVLAVPYAPAGRLRAYLVVSLTVALGVTALGLFQDFSGFEDELPSWTATTVVLFFTPFMAWLVVQTAMQNSIRLQSALARTLAANESLRRSEEALADQARSLQASRARLVAATDRERRRFERDLHDGAQQRLVALGLRLRLAQDLCREDPVGAEKAINALREELHAARTELRDLAHGVYPPVLTQHGLAEALGAAADRCPIPVDVLADDIGRFDPGVEAAVYFCCVEALQNAAKHAGADARVFLSVTHEHDQLGFVVADDGVGFNTGQVPDGEGFDNMRDRLGAAGGGVTIESSPGHGTTVTGLVPVRRALETA
jgi:signal transduction histidine kinase